MEELLQGKTAQVPVPGSTSASLSTGSVQDTIRSLNTRSVTDRRAWIGLSMIALASAVFTVDAAVLYLAIPALSEALRPTSAQLLWVVDAQVFLLAGLAVPMGTLGDLIGRRRLLVIGAAIFGAASAAAAISPRTELLILSRALLGIGGAAFLPNSLSLIRSMFADPRQRAMAVGVWMSAFSAGSAIGPLLGGVMLERFWWCSVFLLSVPVMAVLLVLGPIVLPEYRNPNARRLDAISAAMSLAAVLALTFGLKQIARDGTSALPAASIAAGLAVGVLWIRRQLTSQDPMLELRLFRVALFGSSLAVNFLAVFVAIGYALFAGQYLQLVVGLSPLEAGAWSVPPAIAFIVGANAAPRIAQRVRPAHLMGASLAIAASGLAILTQVGAAGDSGLGKVVTASVVISLGLAPLLVTTTELVVGLTAPERAGTVAGTIETCRQLGAAFGIAVLGSIGMASYRDATAAHLPASLSPEIAAIARETLGAAVGVSRQLPDVLGGPVLEVARSAFTQGMRVAAAAGVVIAMCGAMLVLVSLRKAQRGGAAQPLSERDERS